MAPTYCTPADIAARLQLMNKDMTDRLTFDNSNTYPRLSEIEGWIEDAEDFIDDNTFLSWKEKTVLNEFYDNPGVKYQGRYYRMGVELYLENTDIRNITLLNVYHGGTWTDFVATKTLGQGPRDGDWWYHKQDGVIMLFVDWGMEDDPIEISYTYGKAIVPRQIKDACINLVAAKVLEAEDYVVQFPDNPNMINLDKKVKNFRDAAQRTIDNYRRSKSVQY